MNSLIIDCSAGMKIYVLKEEKSFSLIDENEKKHSDELLVVIDKLLKEAELKINEINNICVCVGPGSFTGVRVAVSVCKGLVIGTNAKVFVLSNLDIFDISKDKNSILVLNGFSDFIYVRITKNKSVIDKCISFEDLKYIIKNEEFDVYAENEKVQKKLNKYEILCQIAKNKTKNAFLNIINKNKNIELNQINPIYLRASQAEIERNKKLESEGK